MVHILWGVGIITALVGGLYIGKRWPYSFQNRTMFIVSGVIAVSIIVTATIFVIMAQ